MERGGDSLYRPITAAELVAARTCRFDPHFFEHWTPPHGETLRHWLPIDAEAYAAFTLPWLGSAGQPEPYETIAEGYARLNIPLPQPITLEAWRADFQIMEWNRPIPPLVRLALDRYSDNADWVFARCWHGQDVHDLKIERPLFVELDDPFVEMPQPYGLISVFPDDVPWFLLNDDTVPVIYIAGPAALMSAIRRVCPGRVVDVGLDDPYY